MTMARAYMYSTKKLKHHRNSGTNTMEVSVYVIDSKDLIPMLVGRKEYNSSNTAGALQEAFDLLCNKGYIQGFKAGDMYFESGAYKLVTLSELY